MPVPTIAQALTLFLVGGVFLHFMVAGGKMLQVPNPDLEPGAWVAQILFVFGGTVATWFVGLHHPISLANGIVAVILATGSVALYEWSRHTIMRRQFGIAWGYQVPDAVCDEGPYRFVRHPIYLSYMLAHLAAVAAVPHWLTASICTVAAALFAHAAFDDERKLAASGISADYAAYRERTGMFLPKL